MNLIKSCLLIISFLLAATLAIGQQSGLSIVPDTSVTISHISFFADYLFREKKMATSFDFKAMRPYSILPAYKVTGIFCRMEHRIEATSNFAPRFRLGSVNYTEWMEGKKPLLSRYAK